MTSRSARVVSAGVLALHLAAGILALTLVPHGFPIGDIHFWSNTLIPAIATLAVAAALIGCVVRRFAAEAVSVLIAAAAGGWTSIVVAGCVMFPTSMTMARCALPALVALALLALARRSRVRTATSIVGLVVGAGLGAVEILAQRAPRPSTRPLGGTLAEVRGEPSGARSSEAAAGGFLVVPCGSHELRLHPLLTFQSRSPDRTWTLLAPGPHGARRTLSRHVTTPTGFRAAYVDDGASTLVVTTTATGLDIEAVSALRTPVYSHLNAFTTLVVPFDATLAFGPTGPRRFGLEPVDDPSARPIQLAYVGADRVFRVARARAAEKGPFSELAHGPLARDEPLTLELRPRDDRDPGCRLVFEDWAAQVSTEPSPTAGWGVPQGSIQFFSRSGIGLVVLTLADTGPGRGFDAVGHAAGTYRNRVRVEPLR